MNQLIIPVIAMLSGTTIGFLITIIVRLIINHIDCNYGKIWNEDFRPKNTNSTKEL